MIDEGNLLRAGTVRVGRHAGEIIEVGTASLGRFLEVLYLSYHSGMVRLPSDGVCKDAVNSFARYRKDMEKRCAELASGRT